MSNPNGYWVASYVDKTAAQDFEDGCKGGWRGVMCERIDISANTIPELLAKLAETYGYEGDYWHVSENGGWISFNRSEDGDSNPIDIDRMKYLWSGNQPVYLCDYSFVIEFRVQRDATWLELIEGVKLSGASCG